MPNFGIVQNASYPALKYGLLDVSSPTLQQIEQHVEHYLAGKLQPTFKSEFVTSSSEPDAPGVKKVKSGF